MPTYEITFTERYLVELPELDASTRQRINENYEACLPFDTEKVEYLDGETTFLERDENNG